MDSEHDRLTMIQSLGGVPVLTATGQFDAVFDHEYSETIDIEGSMPVLFCRSIDVERHSLRKGVSLTVGNKSYKVKRHEPDGSGMSRVLLEC